MITGAVVLNYRTSDDTINCVARLLGDPLIDHVAVVDNDSGAEDRAALVEAFAEVERVTLGFAEMNGGYSVGNNIGLRLLSSLGVRRALVVNPDVTVPVGTVERLASALDDSVVLACPLLISSKGDVDSNGGWWSYRLGRGELEKRAPSPDRWAGKLRTFAGACFLVDLPVFTEMGLLPEEHFLYGEEVDVVVRMLRVGVGWTMVDVEVGHERGGSVGSARDWHQKSYTAHRYAAESALLLSRKYWPRWLPVVFAARVLLAARAFVTGDPKSSLAIVRGIVGGLRVR